MSYQGRVSYARPFFTNTMKIKVLHPVKGYGYFGGEVTDVSNEIGAELVAHGHALAIPEMVREMTVNKAVVRDSEVIKAKGRKK